MFALILTMAMATHAPLPKGLADFIRDKKLTRYDYALADLNGDGRPEALVYAIASTHGEGQPDFAVPADAGFTFWHFAQTAIAGFQPSASRVRRSVSCPAYRMVGTI